MLLWYVWDSSCSCGRGWEAPVTAMDLSSSCSCGRPVVARLTGVDVRYVARVTVVCAG